MSRRSMAVQFLGGVANRAIRADPRPCATVSGHVWESFPAEERIVGRSGGVRSSQVVSRTKRRLRVRQPRGSARAAPGCGASRRAEVRRGFEAGACRAHGPRPCARAHEAVAALLVLDLLRSRLLGRSLLLRGLLLGGGLLGRLLLRGLLLRGLLLFASSSGRRTFSRSFRQQHNCAGRGVISSGSVTFRAAKRSWCRQ